MTSNILVVGERCIRIDDNLSRRRMKKTFSPDGRQKFLAKKRWLREYNLEQEVRANQKVIPIICPVHGRLFDNSCAVCLRNSLDQRMNNSGRAETRIHYPLSQEVGIGIRAESGNLGVQKI